MRFFLHDMSKVSISLLGIALGTFSITNKAFKKGLSTYLRNNNFVTHDDLESLNNSIKEIMLKQEKIEEQLSQK
ncbi:hypothetical protein EDL79_03615 [Ehrlichia ruminantium]|uniref:Uncharacterized protein n=1 Tax=Ehrlichia ruminantium TaxID=779 RepID=A0AAE6QAG5_EHRRU|nr:hypothetical protein [Ehrlichia ruminantium]QGR02709.1 hypothetical protein EDL81_03600 [Ehrlichia ruminantium]QGR03630.1 hypothetical protein EDL80_03605 [Ehrlichia ruminantium]QGR04557.1 hypothetical protein EDL79_03615 [Ehrlichia ruminantium]